MIKKLLSLLSLLVFSVSLTAQQPVTSVTPSKNKLSKHQRLQDLQIGEELRNSQNHCKYDVLQREMLSNPDARERHEAYQKALRKEINKIESKKANGNYKAAVLKVPVVFHVLHLGESIGTGHNISNEQITSSITALNRDFRKLKFDEGIANGAGVDTEIEFCLAAVDPQGNPSTGINRINASGVANYNSIGIDEGVNGADLKNLSKWSTNDYVNIWVVREIDDQGQYGSWGGGTLGYAYPVTSSSATNPNTNPAFNSLDGIVVVNFSLGNDPNNSESWNLHFNKNRTLTHEMGHHLNLQHTFHGASCNEGDCTTEGDYVCDTPPTSQNPNCGSPACSGAQQVENYMDYTGENCVNMFTAGQSTRMRAVLEGFSRSSLVESVVCNAEAVDCDFEANLTTVAVGQDVNFTDLSASGVAINSWTWDFGDGTTSTQQNPTISYATTGLKTVSLTTSNGSSNDTETKTNYIYVVAALNATCDTLYNVPDTSGLTYYPVNPEGFIPGNSSYASGYAERFTTGGSTYNLETITLAIFRADNDQFPGSEVTVNLYNDNAGIPGTILATKNVAIQDLQEGFFNQVTFDAPLQVTGAFYVGWEFAASGIDTLVGIASTPLNNPTLNTAYFLGGAGWADFTSGFGIDVSLAIQAYLYLEAEAEITLDNSSICEGDAINYSANTSINSDGYEWIFNGAAPNNVIGQSAVEIKYDTAGVYRTYLGAFNGCSQLSIDSIDVTVNQTPEVTFNNASDTCNQQIGSATITNNGVSYQWIGSGNTAATESNLGVGNYSAEIVDGNGCVGSGLATIDNVFINFDLTISNDVDTVDLATQSGLVNFEAIGIIDSLSWDFGNGNSSTQTVTATTYSVIGEYRVDLLGFKNGCDKPVTKFIYVINSATAPAAEFSADHTIACAPIFISFTDESTANPSSWLWDITPTSFNFVSSTNSGSQNPVLEFTKAGNYSITLTATNQTGSNSITKTSYITIDTAETPTISLVGNDLICNETAIQYDWYKNSSLVQSGPSNTAPLAGEGSYYVVIYNSNDCINTSEIFTISSVLDLAAQNAKIYPVPTKGRLTIEGDIKISDVSIYTTVGKKISLNMQQAQYGVLVNTTKLQAGTYLLTIGNISRMFTVVK